MDDDDQPVLVTGGTGFLAGWCIRQLAAAGYPVRTTVRDPRRADRVRTALGVPGLEVVAADLGADAGWAAAARGCGHVLHVASPFPSAAPASAEELIRPARDGALRVLRAALDAGARRVVLTSSSSTMDGPGPGPFDETHWADPAGARAYVRSKILAERAAWDEVAARGATDRLVTVAPTAMLGPVLDTGLSYSMHVVSRMLDGRMPGLPRLGFPFVDVRDTAAAHLTAMTEPAAAGRRFVVHAGFRWFGEVAATLRATLGADAAKVPTRSLPDILVRVTALFDSELRQVAGDLGRRTDYDTTTSQRILGWAPRDLDETITDSARSLLARQ